MKFLDINTSAGTFTEIRRDNSFYVDKTPFLIELLNNGLKGKMLFTRPRRFGKSVMLTTIRDFLDITKDSSSLFRGLKIMEETELVGQYLNRYPVVFLSLKDVYGRTMEAIEEKLRTQFYRAANPYSEIISLSPKLDEYKKNLFFSIYTQKIKSVKIADALGDLCDCLYTHYNKPIVVLIDEYDVPLSRAYGTQHYDEVKELIESLFSSVCKENDMIKAVILTGCLYSIKGSTHTGVNNIRPYTVSKPKFSQYIGFTEGEVQKLLSDAGMTDYLGLLREWYDGYLFGNTRIYCPFDVLNFVEDVQEGNYHPGLKPRNYWQNSSETQTLYLREFLKKEANPFEKFDDLLSGKSIYVEVNEDLPYHQLQESVENMWSALLETGYLTKAGIDNETELRIPNKEIQGIFRRELVDYFKQYVDEKLFYQFAEKLWDGKANDAETILCDILEQNMTVFVDQYEYSYQYFITGGFSALAYEVNTELDSGFGRLDIQIFDKRKLRGLVIEVKHSESEEKLKPDLEKAVAQILNKHYSRALELKHCRLIRCFGISIYMKKCLIQAAP